MQELLENYSSIDDLIIPTKYTCLDLDYKCLVYRIETDKDSYDYLKQENRLKEFLSTNIIENTLYGYDGIANEDSYEIIYQNVEYTIQSTGFRQNVSSQYDIDFTFELNNKLTYLTEENGKYYLKVGFEFEISKKNFDKLLEDME